MAKLRYIVLASVGLGAVLLYLLSRASSNTGAFAQHYTLLLVLNVVLAAVLAGLIGYQVWLVKKRIRDKVFGARLTMRLIILFALMAVVPGTLIYGVSVQFLTRSIESWFDVRVDNALEGGMGLGRSVLEAQQTDLVRKAQAMAITLQEEPPGSHMRLLDQLRDQLGVHEATLFSARGTVLAIATDARDAILPQMPGPAILRAVRAQRPYSGIETLADKGLYLRAVVPVNVLSLSEDVRILQLIEPVPPKIAKDAEAVQDVYRDYKELAFSRKGLNKLFALALTMTLLFALLSAIALAFVLSSRMSAPLGLLAEGTKAVAKGDFSPMQPVKARDELGQLMQSFNTMTRQLAETSAVVEHKQQQLEASKGYLESILAHLSSGVIAFDEKFAVKSVNPIAAQLLGVNLQLLRGLNVFEWSEKAPQLAPLAQALTPRFESEAQKEWQAQIELTLEGSAKTLLVRGSRLPAGIDNGYVVVFDDVTRLIQAQRDAAWGEVARRLAHEIKNPLTPIQLSAERLAHKLAAKLDLPDAEILGRATQTIVNQVAALKSMVDEFSQYARQPTLNLQTLDLNQLVGEVLTLYENSPAPVQTELAPALPQVRGDSKLLRQVIHNLLQNAQDALAGREAAQIRVRTDIENGLAVLRVIDNGVGFPPEILARVFEPYVTTKAKGTGLGLAIVKKIVEEHGGLVEVRNIEPAGACVCIKLPCIEASAA
ncbi:MAG: HAMP domain-containing protein [Hydrogenophilales bacterium]|nr:HAMP domain-containing protein [Hydrogenophilales bacterium]